MRRRNAVDQRSRIIKRTHSRAKTNLTHKFGARTQLRTARTSKAEIFPKLEGLAFNRLKTLGRLKTHARTLLS